MNAKRAIGALVPSGNTILRGRLVLSSYAALNLILFVQIASSLHWLFLAIALIGVIDAFQLTWFSRSSGPEIKFTAVNDSGSESAAYLATYLLPFLAVGHSSIHALIGYAIYMFVVVTITANSNLVHINPTLYILRWKIATVVPEGENASATLIYRGPAPAVGETVSPGLMGSGAFRLKRPHTRNRTPVKHV